MGTTELTIVAAPAMKIADITSELNRAWDDTGQRVPRFVVLTRLMGSLYGADAFLRIAAASTLMDYGLDNQTGEILRWNDPEGRRSPWANGPWRNPPGVGRAIVHMTDPGDVTAINRDGISIGIAGQYDDAVSDDAYGALVALVAHHASKAGVPHTTPYSDDLVHPDTGVSFVLWHSTFCGDLKPDPGHVVKELTGRLVQDVRRVMREGGSA